MNPTKRTYFRSRPKAAAGFSFVLIGALSLMVGSSTFASADHVVPVDSESNDNPACTDVDAAYVYEYKIDGTPEDGPYTVSEDESGIDGGGTITIDGVDVVDGVFYFDWSSDISWDAVIVKQGDGATVYDYSPGSNGDTGLHPSLTNGQPSGGVSHVSFCRDGIDPTTTSTEEETTTTEEETTTTEESTTTTEESTTTTEATTTTTEATTTTTEATTTTETDATVLDTVITQAAPTTAATVLGVELRRSLPSTGVASALPWSQGAIVLIGIGLALLAAARMRAEQV